MNVEFDKGLQVGGRQDDVFVLGERCQGHQWRVALTVYNAWAKNRQVYLIILWCGFGFIAAAPQVSIYIPMDIHSFVIFVLIGKMA